MPGKRVTFDDATWSALDLLAHDTMKDFQELADEAFSDLLKKHNRPTDLKDALRRSARASSSGKADKKPPAKAAGSKKRQSKDEEARRAPQFKLPIPGGKKR